MFFNLTTIGSITEAYRSLSVILNSKYITEEVTNAINALTMLAKDTDDHGHRVNNTDQNTNDDNLQPDLEEEILSFDEPDGESMYKQSLFFQKFNSITSAVESLHKKHKF